MDSNIFNIIKNGEGLKIEFKEAFSDIPRNLYETVCSFSNTCGGTILLGVSDNGEIVGVPASNIDKYRKSLCYNY